MLTYQMLQTHEIGECHFWSHLQSPLDLLTALIGQHALHVIHHGYHVFWSGCRSIVRQLGDSGKRGMRVNWIIVWYIHHAKFLVLKTADAFTILHRAANWLAC